MRAPYPVQGVSTDPEDLRYGGPGTPADAERYVQHHETNGHRGDSGTYLYTANTLEQEANQMGWLTNAVPTGPTPLELFTIGMRGEPGYDDDDDPKPNGIGYSHPGPAQDISDID